MTEKEFEAKYRGKEFEAKYRGKINLLKSIGLEPFGFDPGIVSLLGRENVSWNLLALTPASCRF
jgi:hypothetical protein